MASASTTLNIIEEDSKYCTPCKTKNKKIESQYYCTDCEAYYCEDCFELHPRVPYLAKHIVLKHDDIAVWSKVQFKCTTHDKTLEFFCGKHKLLCCHVCVSLKHRSCADMEYILESAKNIPLNDEIKTMVQRTQETLDKVDSYTSKIKNKMEMSQKSKTEYIKELEEVRSRFNKIFDALMKNALGEMGKRFDENTKYSDEITRDLKSFKNELLDLMHQLTTSTAGKEGLIYISLKRGENRAEEINRKLSEIDITTNKDNFKPMLDNGVLENFGNLKQIAYLEDEQMRQEALSTKECQKQASVSSEEYKEQKSVLCVENVVYEESVATGKIEQLEYEPAEKTEVSEPDANWKWEVPEVIPCEGYEEKVTVAYREGEVPEILPCEEYEEIVPFAYGKNEVPIDVDPSFSRKDDKSMFKQDEELAYHGHYFGKKLKKYAKKRIKSSYSNDTFKTIDTIPVLTEQSTGKSVKIQQRGGDIYKSCSRCGIRRKSTCRFCYNCGLKME